MKHAILFLFGCLLLTSASGQSIDQLMNDARYTEAINKIEIRLKQNQKQDSVFYLENQKTEALIRLGKLDEAEVILKRYQQSAVLSTHQQGINATTYGLLYLIRGRNDLSEETLKAALQKFEQAQTSESPEAAQAVTHLGNLYRTRGQYALAEEQLRMAMNLREKKLPANHELMAASYNDLGLIYLQTDADKALDYYEKALSIYEKQHGKQHPKVAIANTNIGFVYQKLELYGDAINYFESSLAIWEKLYIGAHPSKAFVLFSLGNTYKNMNDGKAATGYYERALKMYTESYGLYHPERARVLNALGTLDISENKYNDALKHYQEALQANVSGFTESNFERNPSSGNFYDGYVLLYSLLYKAEALEARHYGKTLKFQDLKLSLETLQVCDTLIDKLRQQTSNESDKLSLGTIASEVYTDGVRIAFGSAQVAFNKKPYEALAFYFAEKSKSAVLLEAISDANAKSFAGIPSEMLEEEKNLKAAIALCTQKLAQKPSIEEERYLRETSYALNRSYESFISKLEKQFPEYFNLKFNTATPAIEQLQQKLDKQTALLSYFIDDKNGRLYIFQITQNKFLISNHSLPKSMDRLITGFRNSIYYREINTYQSTAEELGKLLMPDQVPTSISSLVILPTGRLGIIPFEALLLRATKPSTTYQALPYLINRYAVRYEFAASLILQKQVSAQTSPSIFLCAPVSFEKDNLSDLPGTEDEVNNISQLFKNKNLSAGLFTNTGANETLVKSEQLKKYNFLHFATHGVVDEKNPALSRIFLQADAGSEDGHLYSGEIYNLSFNADLITLSACQTGLGKISKGEGVIGLSRALVYAGANRLIVSFWSVADQSTAIMMADFYKQLLEQPTVDFNQHLRTAKLGLMKQTDYSAPFFWAPFILIGF